MGWAVVISELPAIASFDQLKVSGESDRASGAPNRADRETNSADGAARRRVVNVTGRGGGVAFVIDEAAPMDDVARELGAQLSAQGALFSAGGVIVNTGGRILDARDKDVIRRIFAENSGLQVSRFVSSIGDYSPEPPLPPPQRRPRPHGAGAPLGRAFADLTRGEQRHRAQALLIRATFRSGESVNHRGDVVVLGDMNPGSEILADGDIVVMGTIKGLPHAGASGDDSAAIIALEIASPRVRIGLCEADAPPQGRNGRNGKRRRSSPGQLSIVYARRGGIYVSPFAGRFARYAKGVPYDG